MFNLSSPNQKYAVLKDQSVNQEDDSWSNKSDQDVNELDLNEGDGFNSINNSINNLSWEINTSKDQHQSHGDDNNLNKHVNGQVGVTVDGKQLMQSVFTSESESTSSLSANQVIINCQQSNSPLIHLVSHQLFCRLQLAEAMKYMGTEEAASQPHEEVAARLQTDPRVGLTWREAEFRQRIYGYNEFDVKQEEPLWQKYLEQVCSSMNRSQMQSSY